MLSTSCDNCFGSSNSCPSGSITNCTRHNVYIICSKWYIVVVKFFHMYIGERYFYTRYTTTLSTCSGLLG